jgi:hypothetical protein
MNSLELNDFSNKEGFQLCSSHELPTDPSFYHNECSNHNRILPENEMSVQECVFIFSGKTEQLYTLETMVVSKRRRWVPNG